MEGRLWKREISKMTSETRLGIIRVSELFDAGALTSDLNK